jgi:hypothetical protein
MKESIRKDLIADIANLGEVTRSDYGLNDREVVMYLNALNDVLIIIDQIPNEE